VIVVDNGSSDGSAEAVESEFPGVALVRLQRNEGYPRGNNIGMKYALESYNADYLVILNNDVLVR